MENLMSLDIEANTKEEVIVFLANKLARKGKVSDVYKYIESVKDREKEFTTGFGNGVAIPHGKCDAVNESCFIFAKLKHKVDWNSLDKKPVDLIFLLAISTKEAGSTHIRLLSKIAVSLMENEFISGLRKAETKEAINEIIKNMMKGENL